MKRSLYAALLLGCLYLAGCEFGHWATSVDEQGNIPALQAGKEIIENTGSALAEGGAIAGITALVFTSLKTGLRLYRDYQKSKEEPAKMPAPLPTP